MKYVSLFLWLVMIFSYFMQPFYPLCSNFIVPGLFGFLLCSMVKFRFCLNARMIIFIALFVAYLCVSSIESSLSNNVDLLNIVRFVAIFVTILFAQNFYYGSFNVEYKIFIFVACVKSLVLIGIFSIVFYYQDFTTWRFWAKTAGVGDIYILNSIPRVQLQGNALLVLAFMVNYLLKNKLTIVNAILLFGCVAAGNVAFIGIIILFYGIKLTPVFVEQIKRKEAKLVFSVPCVLIALVLFFLYIYAMMEQKSDVSNAIRKEEVEILLSSCWFFGHGVGSLITAVGYFRDYTGNIYFELQPLYVFYQIGFVGVLMFYFITIYTYIKNRKILLIYILYLIFSAFNPYCFDVTHIVTVIVLSGLAANFRNINAFTGVGLMRKR